MIILSIFAGRYRYLSILKVYLDYLLERGLLTEVHLWNYARNPNDSKYVRSITEHNPKYKLFTPNPNDIKRNHWGTYYDYYIKSDYDDDVILIKCDDDVTYIDVQKFERYTREVKHDSLYFPNIINNDVGAYIQTLNGVHDLLPDSTIDQSLKTRGCTIPLTKWDVGWYMKTECAVNAHEHFLNNVEKYSIERDLIRWDSRISINFFALTMKTAKKYFKMFGKIGQRDDEAFFSSRVCAHTGNCNTIVPYFNVVHFSFGPQLTQELDDVYLPRYKELGQRLQF